MSVGAGYSVFVKDVNLDSVKVNGFKLVKEGAWCSAVVDVDAVGTADISAESYYYGCPVVQDVPIKITQVTVNLDIGSGYNGDILTTKAVERYESIFDEDIEQLWKELVDELKERDINPEYIKSCVEDGYYDGEARLGGGWTHSTFDGTFELDDVNDHNGYNNVESAVFEVTDKGIADYLDKAVTGDNVEYRVEFNGDIYDSYETEDEAVETLKSLIDEALAKGEEVDFYDCIVTSEYWFILGNDNWDYDGYEVVYRAEEDEDYDEYVNSDEY